MNLALKILVTILFLHVWNGQSQTVQQIEKYTLFTKAFGVAYFFTPHKNFKTEDWENFLLFACQELQKKHTEEETIQTINSLFASINCPVVIDKTSQSDSIIQLDRVRKVYTWEHHGFGMGKDKLPSITKLITKLVGYSSKIVRTKQDFIKREELELINGYYCHFNPQSTRVYSLKKLENESVNDSTSRTHDLAAISYIWNTVNYFYPYSDFLKIDWDVELTNVITDVFSERNLQEVLNDLNNLLIDAHASFKTGSYFTKGFYIPEGGYYPIEMAYLSNHHVISHLSDQCFSELVKGDILVAVNNEEIDSVIQKICLRYSGKKTTSLEVVSNNNLLFSLFNHFGTDSLVMLFKSKNGVKKPIVLDKDENKYELINQNFTEAHGYLYIDANTIKAKDFKKNLSLIQNSNGVFFDMRSRPTGSFIKVLGYFTDTNIIQRNLMTSVITSPKVENNSFSRKTGIKVKSKRRQINVPVYFLIGSGLYSYGESCLEVIENGNLGTTIGSNSGGCNGDIRFGSVFDVTWSWTGRLVLENGQEIFQGVGYEPQLPFTFSTEHIDKAKLIEDVLLELGISFE